MARRFEDGADGPLPREWLPEATPLEGSPEWEALVRRVVAAADPVARAGAPWPSVLGAWWRPAAALAAAAAVLLVLLDAPSVQETPGDGALTLSLVAAGGEPTAVLEGLGISADPVLALIALQGRAP
jgi:hypothetical protein